MSKWSNLGPALKDSVKTKLTAGSIGKVWRYRNTTAIVGANLPQIGELWEDNRRVSGAERIENIDNSGYDELSVDTTTQVAGATYVSSSLKLEKDGEERVSVQWHKVQMPLGQHPEFLPGAVHDLYTDTERFKQILAWEAEIDQTYKRAWKYRELDGEGVPRGVPKTITNEHTLLYVKLRMLGYENCEQDFPEVTRISTYRGTKPPNAEDRGKYVLATTVESLGKHIPTGFKWIKTADTVNPVKGKDMWERHEVWNGGKKVYFDAEKINPANETLPT